MTTSLLVEDDLELRQRVSTALVNYGIGVRISENIRNLPAEIARGGIDIVLLDIMLGAADGIELCRQLRQSSTMPVILFTAPDDSISRILGLEVGADDCVAKPFEERELLARINAVLRRCAHLKGVTSSERVGAGGGARQSVTHIGGFGSWQLDWRNRTLLSPESGRVALSNAEYRLLAAFAEHAGQVMSRQDLAELTRRGALKVSERSVDLAVSRLRAKMHESSTTPRLIQTVHGRGYQLMSDRVSTSYATFTLRARGKIANPSIRETQDEELCSLKSASL
jgi:two-component system OmpR family response regulator